MKGKKRIAIVLTIIMSLASVQAFAAESPKVNKDEQLLFEKADLASQKISQLDIGEEEMASGRYEKTIDLGDDCYARIELEDVAENGTGISLMASTPASTTLWKAYGDRKFTSTYELSVAGQTYKMSLCNHYTLGSYGIKVRYSERMLYLNGVLSKGGGAVYTTQTSAGVGQSVSMNCPFNLSGFGKTYRLYNNVKCLQIDTAGQQVKVTQSWSGKWE